MKIDVINQCDEPKFDLYGVVMAMYETNFDYIHERCINCGYIEETERIRHIEQELFCENVASKNIEIIHIDIKNRDLDKVIAWLVAFNHAIWFHDICVDSNHYGEDGNVDWMVLRTSEKVVILYDFNMLMSSQKCMNDFHQECIFDLLEAVRNCGQILRLGKFEDSQIIFKGFNYEVERIMLAIQLESYREYSDALKEMAWRASKRLEDIRDYK